MKKDKGPIPTSPLFALINKDSYVIFPNENYPDIPDNTLWFQQDGAPPHYARSVREYLDVIFPQRLLGRRGPIEGPAISPDLTPIDYVYGKNYEIALEMKWDPLPRKSFRMYKKNLYTGLHISKKHIFHF
ncbi:hypothetical protein NQ318_010421, partial [Aromia moschata]